MTDDLSGSDFPGFDDRTVQFLGDLRAHNDRAWFEANRSRYEADWLAPARAFVVAAGEALREIAPDVRAEPKVNGSIFRVNRDARFSQDKTPYKDHLDFWFWDGVERRRAVSGFYLRLTPDVVGIGAGAHHFDPTQLNRYRDLVVDPTAGDRLVEAVRSVERAGFGISRQRYKRVPRGFDEPDDESRSRLLRHDGLFAGDEFEHPASMSTRRFVSWCMTRWRKQQPVHDWLVEHLQEA